MRAKIVTRLAILIGALVLTGVGAFAIWNFQVGKMARGVLEQAEQALEKKDYGEAVDLFEQHLLIVPDDQAVQLQYADALLKLSPSPKNQDRAMSIYGAILNREPGRVDVRLRAAELAFEMRRFDQARLHLTTLLRPTEDTSHKFTKEDGHLEYMMGRCYEEDKSVEEAARYYKAAIEHESPERSLAGTRLAVLIRDDRKLGTPDDADKIIDGIVKADPDNYRVYLERGQYRRKFGLEGAAGDFRKARDLAPDRPEIYRELAESAERSTALEEPRRILDRHRPFAFPLPAAIDVARQVLEDGLARVPDAASLYLYRADLERKAGDPRTAIDRSIAWMRRGVEKLPSEIILRWQLARNLFAAGDKYTGELYLHIQEMKGLDVAKPLIDYLLACYYYNTKEYEKSRQILSSLQGAVAQNPELKGLVNMLLSQCYGQLHEPDLQWEASQRAFNATPNDPARMRPSSSGRCGDGSSGASWTRRSGSIGRSSRGCPTWTGCRWWIC